MHNLSYENKFNLHVNEISFSYEKMGTKTRFEEEAKGNSEMAYWNLEMLVFEERGKPEYPEKNLSEQRREPTTNSTHI